ncbi:SphA family protein [Xanthobacter autotrophicus]|uniref:SphA family protein n=1 Tax=Xanthobacter autotrophicus TaxID=280 RepID=UPI00372CD888
MKGLFDKGSLSSAVFCVALGLGAPVVHAAESISPAGPIGGTDIRSALLPPPGNYGAAVAGGIDLTGWYTADDWLPATGNVEFGGLGWLHVYDLDVLGGRLASSIFVGVQETCFGLTEATKRCAQGLRDTYSDIFVWSKFVPSADFASQPPAPIPIPYGTAFLVGFGMNFPTGAYNAEQGINIGSNFYTFSPNIGITHTTKSWLGPTFGDATEFSARMFFNFYTENTETNYKTGPVISLDFALTERKGPLQYGLTGTGFRQISDDTLFGVAVGNNGNRASALNIGPLVAYDFFVDQRPFNIMFKGLFTVWGENNTESMGLTVRLVTKL